MPAISFVMSSHVHLFGSRNSVYTLLVALPLKQQNYRNNAEFGDCCLEFSFQSVATVIWSILNTEHLNIIVYKHRHLRMDPYDMPYGGMGTNNMMMAPGQVMGQPAGYYNGMPYNNGFNPAYQQGYAAGKSSGTATGVATGLASAAALCCCIELLCCCLR